jgi:soluble cytochrome b562
MKTPLAFVIALAFVAPAQEKRHDPKSETPLSQQMERIDDAMHKLKRGVRDSAQRDTCLTEVANAQQACLAAKLLTPKMAPSVPEAERAAFVRDFRKGVAALLVEFTNLEVALLDGDAEKAVASYKKLESMEDEGHNKFTNE